jgi:hypothetical protein
MPIVDIEVVTQAAGSPRLPEARALADALGRVFGSATGRTWVRVHALDAACYAENDSPVAAGDLPVFVTVLHARPPTGAALQAEVSALTEAVAACAAREVSRVHVSYAPAAAGRQAFGGRLV